MLPVRSIASEPATATTSTSGIQTEDLGPLPKQVGDALCISEDGLHVATVMPSGSRQVVYYDGKPGPQFDEIGRWGGRSGPAILVSKDGSHVTYIARRGGNRIVWCDGKEIQADLMPDVSGDEGPGSMRFGEQAARAITFSGDGKHIAYIIQGSEGPHVVFDGTENSGFQSVDHPIFSNEGGRYAYVAHNGDQQAVVIDGKAGDLSQQEIKGLQFSPDGKHYAYLSVAGAKSRMVLDGEPGPDYATVDFESAQFTINGRLSYVATKPAEAGGTTVGVIDGKETQGIEPGDQFQFSKDGMHVAFVAMTPEGQRVVVDGKAGRSYDTIRNLHFSPDGSRVGYKAKTQSGEFAVVDEKESDGFSSVSDIAFSENGKRFAYFSNTDRGQVIVVVDGEPSKPYREFVSLALSPDGSRYAYEALINFGEPEVVIDGKAARTNLVATLEPPIGAGEKAVFRFSPNSKHLAMASMVSGGGKYIVTVDGVAGPTSGWCARFIFSPDSSHFAYVTREPTRGEGWNTVDITVDRKVVQSMHTPPQGDIVLIAQAVEDSRNTGLKRVNPKFFQFREDGKLKYLVVKDGKIYRVSVTPGAAIPLPSSSVPAQPNRPSIPRTRNSPPGKDTNVTSSANQPQDNGLQGGAANAVSAAHAPGKSTSTGGNDGSSIPEQIVQQLSQGDAESLGALYADTVDYMNKGPISNGAIQNELQQFFERWPVQQWTITGPVKVEPRGTSVEQVTFSVNYNLSNPQTGRHSSGIAKETLTLAADASGAMKIISQHEQTTNSPPRDSLGKGSQRP